jgi:hypothetical protein
VARIAGIDVRVDNSWVVIALLITYSLYLRFSSGGRAGPDDRPADSAEIPPGAERPVA